jgi:hypothetical protein
MFIFSYVYSHNSPEHVQQILELAEPLRENGIEIRLSENCASFTIIKIGVHPHILLIESLQSDAALRDTQLRSHIQAHPRVFDARR